MPEYRCRDCGEYFDEPHRWVERHGFTDGLYESWGACPCCGSCDYDFSSIVDTELELEIDDEATNMTKNEERINKLFEELVPVSGKAESLAGELIRAMSRIAYRFYNDGDQVGIGYGKTTCNPAARFLMAKGSKRVSSLATAIWGIYDESAYEDLLDILAGAVADYVEQTPCLRNTPTEDMFSYRTDEDVLMNDEEVDEEE